MQSSPCLSTRRFLCYRTLLWKSVWSAVSSVAHQRRNWEICCLPPWNVLFALGICCPAGPIWTMGRVRMNCCATPSGLRLTWERCACMAAWVLGYRDCQSFCGRDRGPRTLAATLCARDQRPATSTWGPHRWILNSSLSGDVLRS